MRAYRMIDWARPPALVDVEVPEPGPGQVLIRVAGNGLCHSDLTMMEIPAEIGPLLDWRMPFTLGHETAGWVERTGTGVDGVSTGDAVLVVSPASCGRCRYCGRGDDSMCDASLAGRGYGRDGGLADYVLVDDVRALVALGDLDPVTAAPLADAGATTHHAVARTLPRLGPDSTAAVIGAGGLGAFAIQILRALSPARVVAIDPDPVRRTVAADLGAHDTLDSVTALGPHLAGDPADVVIDLVGTDETIAAGLAALRRGGAFALIGTAGGTLRRPWYGTLPREAEIFTFQGSGIADAHAVVALARAGLVRSPVERFPLDRVADAYEALRSGSRQGRIVVTPSA